MTRKTVERLEIASIMLISERPTQALPVFLSPSSQGLVPDTFSSLRREQCDYLRLLAKGSDEELDVLFPEVDHSL
jgi:hypothetical protein